MLSKILIGLVVALALLFVGYYLYMTIIGNPRVVEELRANPDGLRAARVTLLTLPDGTSLPVNFLREDNMVYMGADGRWWRPFADGPRPVTLLIRGETLTGNAVAILDDPAHTADIFARLRPTAPTWLPGRLGGVLVEVTLDNGAEE